MSDNAKSKVRSLEKILSRGCPRQEEYESLTGKIRRGEKKKALTQIIKIYECNDAEAEIVFAAMKEIAVGRRTELVEIPLAEVPEFKISFIENPLELVPQFLGRSGYYVGPLTRDPYGYTLNGKRARANEIDQVWKVVQAS
ncbi:hypothetical protein O9X98_08965 [Agrobacterium salinitolerans]|nr:hypothetical protein [Agrobacterium salinitolerans]